MCDSLPTPTMTHPQYFIIHYPRHTVYTLLTTKGHYNSHYTELSSNSSILRTKSFEVEERHIGGIYRLTQSAVCLAFTTTLSSEHIQ